MTQQSRIYSPIGQNWRVVFGYLLLVLILATTVAFVLSGVTHKCPPVSLTVEYSKCLRERMEMPNVVKDNWKLAKEKWNDLEKVKWNDLAKEKWTRVKVRPP
jgi:hypothetical protein